MKKNINLNIHFNINRSKILNVLLLISAVLFTVMPDTGFAIPVVNENVANSGILTIYPDHADPHRYYIAPNVVVISRNDKNTPQFVYYEYSKGSYTVTEGSISRTRYIGLTGVAQFSLKPAFTYSELEEEKIRILKKDPEAQFSGIPFIASILLENGLLSKLIKENSCTHLGGLIGQEQECTLVLTDLGRTIFHSSVTNRNLFTTLQFNYQINAVVRKADNTFSDVLINHGIAVRIDGNDLADHPELLKWLE